MRVQVKGLASGGSAEYVYLSEITGSDIKLYLLTRSSRANLSCLRVYPMLVQWLVQRHRRWTSIEPALGG